ncbi:MAG: FkbM family methyltransferase [Deltaproteobacteria bacterium]|nr:FkbM family methyltransferase [Deltaproteobacteria bacterium]
MKLYNKILAKFDVSITRRSYINKLEQSKVVLSKKNNQLEQIIAGLNQKNRQLEQSIVVSSQQNNKLEQSKVILSQKNNQLEQNIVVLNQKNIQLEQSIVSFNQKNTQLEQMIGGLNQKNNQLEQNINKLEKKNSHADRMGRLCSLLDVYAKWINFDDDMLSRIEIDVLETKYDIDSIILNHVCKHNILPLKDAEIEFIELNALKVLIHEIMFNEDYFFTTDSEEPFIIDGGSNFGLAVYYFKHLYPKSKIMAFEPDKRSRQVLERNVERNKWADDVRIMPYALDTQVSEKIFYIDNADTMAGSLTTRRSAQGKTLATDTVQTRRLSEFLQEVPVVDYLKLDIEGLESEVLDECADLLKKVKYIFCEYHRGNGLSDCRIENIFKVLRENCFDVQISKSFSATQQSFYKPMLHVDKPYSACLWAKNKTTS